MSMPAWSQGGQPMMQHNGRPPPSIQRRSTNPPPVCFNCGVEGHFLVACPEATRNTPGALNPILYQPYSAPRPPAQQQYSPLGGPVQYPPLQQSTQYGPPAPQYPYGQPQTPAPQTYGAPLPYARPGFHPPQYNQYPTQHGPPQFNNPGYQGPLEQFGPPAPVSYQQPPSSYPTHNAGYGSNFQAPPVQHQPPQQQWSAHPPAVEPVYQNVPRSHSAQQRNAVKYSNSPLQPGNPVQPEPLGAPVNQIQKQQTQSLQHDYRSTSNHQRPPTPSSRHGSAQHGSRPAAQTCIAMSHETEIESPVSSAANTPYGGYGCGGSDDAKDDSEQVLVSSTGQEQGPEKPEEDEVGEAATEDAMFKWEFKHIFKEPPILETIELAQPLSASVKLTPVPLVQDWCTIVTSISRHARKDNLKDFLRPTHTLPQWSELKEDPAFADIDLNGPSIPFNKLGEWIFNHHTETDEVIVETEIMEEIGENPRKRARSDAGEAHNTPGQDQADRDPEIDKEVVKHPAKRQKNDTPTPVQDEGLRTPSGMTPVIYRSGTPCGDVEGDDAWAPLPGESASTPQDPTEALLASLGVTGSPKPVQKEPIPQYMNELEEVPRAQSSQPSHTAQPTLNQPVNQQVFNSAPVKDNATLHNQNGPPTNYQHNPQVQHRPQTNHAVQTSPQNGPPMHQQNGSPMNSMKDPPINQNHGFPVHNQYGPPSNNQPGPPVNQQNATVALQHGPINNQYEVQRQGPPQYGANGTYATLQYPNSPAQNTQSYGAANASYPNRPPHDFHVHNQYGPGPGSGPPANTPYTNGQQNNYVQPNSFAQQSPQQGPPQWGAPQNQAYSYGPQAYPQQVPPPNQQYGNPQSTPVSNAPGPFHAQQQQSSQQYNSQQGPQQFGPPQGQQQYGQPRNQSFSDGSQILGTFAPQQGSPTNYGNSQNGQYASQYQNGDPQTNSNHALLSPYANDPQNSIPQTDGSAQQSFCNGINGSAPPRQDLNNMNGHRSYGNGASVQDTNIQNGAPQFTSQPATKGTAFKDETAMKQEQNIERVKKDRRDSDSAGSLQASDETGNPLSPESAMILGKLERKPDRTSYGEQKPGEKRKLSQSVVNARKKRPQPEVAEAYGFV
ncbi:unnamed protein product [Diplocarpon coronariae]|uniref:CCHC-type domain-containing protein n=1 Tax=Diplocarpon coronariae TaxID=2795749 RepID=A0A218ZFI0_9HELO|nr:hypothetical protein B2J93_6230 [Marssonina coronariae]